MKRRIIALVAVLSLLLCVAAVALWVRSHDLQDEYNAGPTSFTSRHGSLVVLHFSAYPEGSDTSATGYSAIPVEEGNYQWAMLDEMRVREYGPNSLELAILRAGGFEAWRVTMDYWPVAVVASLLPAIWGTQMLRRWLRARQRKCPTCGYDLNATSDRCPECGTVTAAADQTAA